MRKLLPVVALVASSLLIACSGAQPASSGGGVDTDTTAEPATTGAPDSAAVPTTWSDDMPKEQMVAFMKTRVMPKMNPVFTGHDAAKYPSVTCQTCHGPKLQNPKEFLPKLTMQDGMITSFKDKPEISKWMAEQVVPEMASAMGMEPFNPETKSGFGCGGCHTVEMK